MTFRPSSENRPAGLLPAPAWAQSPAATAWAGEAA
jgi:hypothetical protein